MAGNDRAGNYFSLFTLLEKGLIAVAASSGDYEILSAGENYFAVTVPAKGFIHLSLEKRAKSESADASLQPCSMARAARWASVTRLATA